MRIYQRPMIAFVHPFKPREPIIRSPISKYLTMLVQPCGWTTNTINLRRLYRVEDEVLSASARRDIHGDYVTRYQVRTDKRVMLVYMQGLYLRSRINWNAARRRVATIRASRITRLLLCARRRRFGLDEPGLGRVIRDFFRARCASSE